MEKQNYTQQCKGAYDQFMQAYFLHFVTSGCTFIIHPPPFMCGHRLLTEDNTSCVWQKWALTHKCLCWSSFNLGATRLIFVLVKAAAFPPLLSFLYAQQLPQLSRRKEAKTGCHAQKGKIKNECGQREASAVGGVQANSRTPAWTKLMHV